MLDLRHLPNQLPDEEVTRVLRRHPIILAPLISVLVLLLLAPFIILWLIWQNPELMANPVIMPIIVMGGSIFFLYAWLFIFQHFVDYYLDAWIVTNKRVLNIETHGLFSRTVSELRLHRVQDVTSIVKGFWHTMFNFGDMEIQTAGEKTRFIFEQIPDPNAISKIVIELADKNRREQVSETMEEFGMVDKPNQS